MLCFLKQALGAKCPRLSEADRKNCLLQSGEMETNVLSTKEERLIQTSNRFFLTWPAESNLS